MVFGMEHKERIKRELNQFTLSVQLRMAEYWKGGRNGALETGASKWPVMLGPCSKPPAEADAELVTTGAIGEATQPVEVEG